MHELRGKPKNDNILIEGKESSQLQRISDNKIVLLNFIGLRNILFKTNGHKAF